MAKATKKVDYKKVEKESIAKIISEALVAAGYESLDGADFGFTAGTIVARGKKCDIQIKPITPKAGVDRYEALVEEEEVEETPEDKKDTQDDQENSNEPNPLDYVMEDR